MPRIDSAIDVMSGATVFSAVDLASGYWQVELDNTAQAISAFVTPFGLFEWCCMPFRLCNVNHLKKCSMYQSTELQDNSC